MPAAPVATRYQNLDKLHLPPRPSDAMEHLVRILDALADDYGAQKIIAFGSCVRGGVTEHSDIDLCVVREHPPGCTHPTLDAGLALRAAEARISIDLLVRTPARFQQAILRPFGVMDEIVRHGLTLYER